MAIGTGYELIYLTNSHSASPSYARSVDGAFGDGLIAKVLKVLNEMR